MEVSEESRHRLYGRLEEVLGHDEATTFMAMVRPQGWDDVATKGDIALLKTDITLLKSDLEQFEARLEARIAVSINQALTTQTRTLIVSNASMLAGLAALAAILAR
jgi:hypothetical protein